MSSPLLVPGSDQIVADLRRRWDGADGRSGGERHGKELPTERPPVIVRKGVELLTWVDLPPWQQHGSGHVHTGYRRACGDVWQCVHSWTYLHNETINIYSHIIGACVFLSLPLYFFITEVPPRLAIATWSDIIVCCTYFFGVAICFILSAAFHTFMSHSERFYLLGMKLDIQGVLVLMWSATVPLIYYSFPGDEPSAASLRVAYHTAIGLLAAACSAATLLPQLSGPVLGPARAALFAAFGAGSFLVPVAHGVLKCGLRDQGERIGLPWIAATGVFNGTGAVAYMLKFPEVWYPRRFDLFGASHQIMHVMVVAAALTFTRAVVVAFDFLHEHGVQCKV